MSVSSETRVVAEKTFGPYKAVAKVELSGGGGSSYSLTPTLEIYRDGKLLARASINAADYSEPTVRTDEANISILDADKNAAIKLVEAFAEQAEIAIENLKFLEGLKEGKTIGGRTVYAEYVGEFIPHYEVYAKEGNKKERLGDIFVYDMMLSESPRAAEKKIKDMVEKSKNEQKEGEHAGSANLSPS